MSKDPHGWSSLVLGKPSASCCVWSPAPPGAGGGVRGGGCTQPHRLSRQGPNKRPTRTEALSPGAGLEGEQVPARAVSVDDATGPPFAPMRSWARLRGGAGWKGTEAALLHREARPRSQDPHAGALRAAFHSVTSTTQLCCRPVIFSFFSFFFFFFFFFSFLFLFFTFFLGLQPQLLL